MKKITHIIGDQTFDIFIGKNAAENWKLIDDADTFDLWFHLDDKPSCHVILKQNINNSNIINNTNNTLDYPNQIIYIAAEQCKLNSKYKHLQKLKITYTEISNISKGKEVGSVFVNNAKYIFI